jgi:Xaa-Pro aminopeptidase
MLDEVAWLLNIRGGDVPCCPVTLAYATVSAADATVYLTDASKLGAEAAAQLAAASVQARARPPG